MSLNFLDANNGVDKIMKTITKKRLKLKKRLHELYLQRFVLKKIINEENVLKAEAAYLGIDPTAPSLHLGHLVNLTLLKELHKFGIKPIVLIGEATARIGDPSFRSKKRKKIDEIKIHKNAKNITAQIKRLLPEAKIVNNLKYYEEDATFLNVLKRVGDLFTVNYLLQRESFSDANEKGLLTYSAFSYIIMQAMDFADLNHKYKCSLQIGGSDQEPNIVVGIKLINRIVERNNNVCKVVPAGITTPLLTNKGVKMSKTNKDNVGIDEKLTSINDMYQYIYNLDDHVAKKGLISLDYEFPEEDAERMMVGDVVKTREIQKQLFNTIANGIYPSAKGELKTFNLHTLKKTECLIDPLKKGVASGIGICELLKISKIVTSNNQARRLIEQKAIKVNGKLVTDPKTTYKTANFKGEGLLLQKGKKVFRVFRIKTGESSK